MATREMIPAFRAGTGLRVPEGGWAGRLIIWLRGLGQASAAQNVSLRVEARVGLGPRKSLVLVQCCGRRVLLAVSGDSIAPVLEVEKEASEAAAGGKRGRRGSAARARKGAAQ